ncbi:MAG TPA: TlyA family RNA methyltransferase [Caulobacteraceae bacterium]
MSRKRADIVLVERGLFESRAKARAAIEADGVKADGRAVGKASDLVEETAEIVAEAAHPYVGRGALKLAHALALWPVAVEGAVVLDVGASTGGFSEVCLRAGAARVYAVDVGRGQLHPTIAADERVVELSGVDVRDLTAALVARAPDLIVSDVSFISLEKALPAALDLAGPGADLICLVKPQFEVGRGNIGKGGVVKDAAARELALASVAAFLERSGWTVVASAESPITGGEGNVEYLLHARKRPPTP